MTESIVERFRREPERVLDLLVDGELAPHDRRELVAALDDEPAAWRQCALAFLEAQSWRGQMARLCHEPPAVVATASGPQRARDFSLNNLGAWVAIAASLLAAFALGSRYPIGRNWFAADQRQVAQVGPEQPPQLDGFGPEFGESEPWEMVTMAYGGDGQRVETFKLPILNAAEVDPQWLANPRATLPQGLIDRLRQDGFEVHLQQELLPLELSDGRQAIVPVEQMVIHNPEYVEFH